MERSRVSRRDALIGIGGVVLGATGYLGDEGGVTAQNDTNTQPTVTTAPAEQVTGPSATVRSSELVTTGVEFGPEYAVRAEVVNDGTEPLRSVEGSAKFYDGDGALLDTESTIEFWLEPGEVWDAYVPYFGDEQVVGHGFTVEYRAGTLPSPAPTVTVREQCLVRTEDDDVLVTGLAEHTGSQPIDYLTAIAKFYAGNGHLLDTDDTIVSNVAPGETWRFELRLIAHSGSEAQERVRNFTLVVAEE